MKNFIEVINIFESVELFYKLTWVFFIISVTGIFLFSWSFLHIMIYVELLYMSAICSFIKTFLIFGSSVSLLVVIILIVLSVVDSVLFILILILRKK